VHYSILKTTKKDEIKDLRHTSKVYSLAWSNVYVSPLPYLWCPPLVHHVDLGNVLMRSQINPETTKLFSGVADPGCLSRIRLFSIPDSNFFHLGSRIHIKEFKYFNPKIVFKLSEK
jgi:hypothetical protein